MKKKWKAKAKEGMLCTQKIKYCAFSDEETDSAPSPAKRSTTPISKEVPSSPPTKSQYQLDKFDIHIKHNTDFPSSPHPEIDMVHIKETTESPASPDSALTMESVSENNRPSNPRSGTPMAFKILVPTPTCLAKLQIILKQQLFMNKLDRHFASQVQVMKEKTHPLKRLKTPAPN